MCGRAPVCTHPAWALPAQQAPSAAATTHTHTPSGGLRVQAVARTRTKAGLSERDCVHLLELAHVHGFASWHAAKCFEELSETMRTKTLQRLQVRCAQSAGCGHVVG